MTTRREVMGGLAAVTLAGSVSGVPLGIGVASWSRWSERFVWAWPLQRTGSKAISGEQGKPKIVR